MQYKYEWMEWNHMSENMATCLIANKTWYTYAGGLTIDNSSAGVFGTRRIIIFRPSVDPIPIDANDRIDVASENSLPEPLQSLNTNEFVRGNDNSVCNGCGDVYDVVRYVVGVKEPSLVSFLILAKNFK